MKDEEGAGRVAIRPLTMLAVVAAITALFLLAASLNNLEFKPGQSFSLLKSPEAASANPEIKFPPLLFDLFLLLIGIAFLVSLFMLLRSPRERRLLLRKVGQLLLIVAIGLLVSNLYRPEETIKMQVTPGARAPSPVTGPPGVTEDSGAPVEATSTPPAVSGWVRYAVTLVVLGLVGAFGYWAWRLFRSPKEELHQITLSALDDLFAGRNWEDVVIRCYADMSAAISRGRGIGRHEAMTPREFAARLEQIGLPVNSVSRLTRLFEQARYGSHRSTPAQIREATDCLTEIMGAVGHMSRTCPEGQCPREGTVSEGGDRR